MAKVLKCPNSTHIKREVQIADELIAINEVLDPRVEANDLRGTPIPVIGKTTHNVLLQIEQIQLVS